MAVNTLNWVELVFKHYIGTTFFSAPTKWPQVILKKIYKTCRSGQGESQKEYKRCPLGDEC